LSCFRLIPAGRQIIFIPTAMQKLFTNLFFVSVIFSSYAGFAGDTWEQVDPGRVSAQLQIMHPARFLVFTADEVMLKLQLWNLSNDPNDGVIVGLPLADGTMMNFKVWQTPMMPDELAAKYPDIKTFTAEAVGNHTITAKLDFTLYGFHAMIFNGAQTSFIDPFDNMHDGFYMVHYKSDEERPFNERMKCLVKSNGEDNPAGEPMDMVQTQLPELSNPGKPAQKIVNGSQLRTYRLALSADDFYCQAATSSASPTIAASLSKMTTTMNRINGVYEREFSVTMTFVAHEDTLIWPTHTGSINGTDPFFSIDANAGACLTQNQTSCDTRIGSANYDIGHVFTTGGGGLSLQGVICSSGNKAQSVTGSPTPVGDGFDIDYVAHEMGHEHGGSHPFNNGSDGSCGGGNAVSSKAYEPGSGSTIMAYAGICDPDDLQPHSDAYFHAINVNEIVSYINGGGNSCAVKTSTGNKLVSLAPFSASYTIPYKTPFELIGPTAVDSVADTANTYCWEQWNRGDFGNRLINTFVKGPIFRSYNPVYTSTRVFPKISMVLSGVLSNAGVEDNEGEKAPDTARYLTFKMTVRDMISGTGCITTPDDTIHLNVVSTGPAGNHAGFKVTSPSTFVSWPVGSSQSVTWNVVGTNTAPVNCDSVDIYISPDAGLLWPTLVGSFPNTGSASIIIPASTISSTTERIKVKGRNNVFFNVNSHNFQITGGPTYVQHAQWTSGVEIYPVPAKDVVHFTNSGNDQLQVTIINSVGQVVWKGQCNNQVDVPVSSWAKGVYYVQFISSANGGRSVKPMVVE
jgi:reprolysin-like metallo-peptidase family M12B/type IX secretion system substrate protein